MEGWRVAFLDVLMILVVVLIPLVNSPKANEAATPPGSLMFEIRWPDECKADVDLWIRGPQGRAIGYSNPSGATLNLLRDDRGYDEDLSSLNYENAYSRGLPDGDYVANLHLYDHRGGCAIPVPVDVNVEIHQEGRAKSLRVFQGHTDMQRIGEEKTVIRFALKNGRLVPNSENTVPIKLRGAA